MIDQDIAAPSAMLRDGREVTIRPLDEDDRAALLAFGRALPQDDWLYMENDLQNPEIITRLVNASRAENWRQVVAVTGDALVAYSAVRRLHGWSSHVADIHLIVSHGWRRQGRYAVHPLSTETPVGPSGAFGSDQAGPRHPAISA